MEGILFLLVGIAAVTGVIRRTWYPEQYALRLTSWRDMLAVLTIVLVAVTLGWVVWG